MKLQDLCLVHFANIYCHYKFGAILCCIVMSRWMVFLEILCSLCEFWIYYEVSGSLLLVLGLCSGALDLFSHRNISSVFQYNSCISQSDWSPFFNKQGALPFENACRSVIFAWCSGCVSWGYASLRRNGFVQVCLFQLGEGLGVMHSKDWVATGIVIHLARRLWFSLHPSKQDGLLGTCSMLTSF